MALKSRPRNLSFDILREENDVVLLDRLISDPLRLKNGFFNSDDQLVVKKKKKRSKKKRNIGKLIEFGDSVGLERGKIVNLDGFEVGFSVGEEGRGGDGVGGFGGELRERGVGGSLGSEAVSISGIVENGEEEGGVVESGNWNGGDVRGSRGSEAVLISGIVENGEEGEEEGGVVESGSWNGGHVGELRQRNVGGSMGSEEVSSWGMGMVMVGEENGKEVVWKDVQEGRGLREIMSGRTSENEVSLDWKRVMPSDCRLMENFPIETSPIKHFMEDLHTGHSLKSTVTLGNEKDRERVYDTIFHLPWRCELLIDVGFFVCLDSFLSVLTIMPVRMAMALWKPLKTRQFLKPSAEELSDFGCLLVLASGVTILQQIDISLIYHMIRGQGTIKLYVVYNVLEIFDKLFQSFVGDVMQTMFQSADELATCAPENVRNVLLKLVSDEVLAIVSSILHSFILLVQAITLSTCIVAHNNALFALLVSNNFSEIKSNVFKRFSKDNVHSIAYSDSVERFHICAFLLFVLAQNLLEAEGPWFNNFLHDALLVYLCEVLIDIIKHSFIAKFNDIKPVAFSEFLEDLSKQTLNILTEPEKRRLIFVPLAPACVVLRVLRPVYAAHIPYNPLSWRLLCMFLLSALTFVMLGVLKIMVSKGLKQHARWYVKRCEKRKSHTD